MILATSSGNVYAWRKVIDQSENENKSYSDWSKNKGWSATWFGTNRIESTLFSDIKSQRKTENIALVDLFSERGSPPRAPIFFLTLESTGYIKFLVLSDPLNTIMQKNWVVTGLEFWESRFEIAWISFHCFVCKMIEKLICAPPSVDFMINRLMYFII